MRTKTPAATPMLLAVLTVLTACGGSSKSPVSPSSPVDSGMPGGGAATGAVISGTVQGAGPSALTSAITTHAVNGLTVSVARTSLSTTVDPAGRFTLTGVPSGDVQLRFTGTGIDASVPVSGVQPSDNISIVVTLSGANAKVESEVRNGNAEAEQELEGRVEALPPTMSSGSLRVGGRTVKTDSSTRIEQANVTKTFADLKINQQVHVRGRASGSDVLASLIDIQSTNTAVPAEVNGDIDTLTGNASSFQFKIGSTVVKGDSTTQFFGDGDRTTTFSALSNGTRVEVKGEQRDGFIYATRIHANPAEPNDDHGNDNGNDDHGNGSGGSGGSTGGGHDDNGQQQGEAEAEGTLIALQGGCPAISFTVGSDRVVTSASTNFDGGACPSLKNGDRVQVNGTKQSDGSIAAKSVKKEK